MSTVWELVDSDSDFPSWFVRGRTVLIPKEGCTRMPSQYSPITCLNVLYKALTGALNVLLGHHVDQAGLIPNEKKALKKGRRGCLDAMYCNLALEEHVSCLGGLPWVLELLKSSPAGSSEPPPIHGRSEKLLHLKKRNQIKDSAHQSPHPT